MTNYTNASERERLEKLGIQATYPSNKFPDFAVIIQPVLQKLLMFLTAGDQPRIWRVNYGKTVLWNAYDPVSDCRVEGISESELRSWLEKRYTR